MQALELLLNRHSCAKLTEPAPDEQELEIIYRAGIRAPDHGRLKPWRFITVQGHDIDKLGEIFAESAEELGVSEERARSMPRRAPLIIIAVSSPVNHFKVPAEEQLLSTGSAIQLMQLAAMAQGYNGIWRTGPVAKNKTINEKLGLQDHEKITGYLYIGTPALINTDLGDPDLSQFVTSLN